MKKASIILIIYFVLGCAGQNLNTQETTIQNQKENTPPGYQSTEHDIWQYR
jgi:hypothetical protein